MSRSRGPVARVDGVRYHRNGITGDGFYSVAFVARNGREMRPMIGVVFTGSHQGPLTDGRDIHGYVRMRKGTATLTTFAVLDPANPLTPYRGEDFIAQLAEAIDEWTETERAFGPDAEDHWANGEFWNGSEWIAYPIPPRGSLPGTPEPYETVAEALERTSVMPEGHVPSRAYFAGWSERGQAIADGPRRTE
jgi:hypothetical protein